MKEDIRTAAKRRRETEGEEGSVVATKRSGKRNGGREVCFCHSICKPKLDKER